MFHDLHQGRLTNLEADSQRWLEIQKALSEKYAPQFAFSMTGWNYFKAFFGSPYADAGRITRDFTVISPPLNTWRYQVDKGRGAGLEQSRFQR